MLSTLAARIGSHPRRALLAVFAFLVLAGAIGGPVAGALRTSGGFTPPDADSAVAEARIEQATGRAPSAGVVLLARGEAGSLPERLRSQPGIAAVRTVPSTDGRSTLVLGTLTAAADEDDVASEVLDAFAKDRPRVLVGGSAVASHQIGTRVSEDLGRAELLALPLLVLLSLAFFGGRAALLPLLVGTTTVLGTFLALTAVNAGYGLSIFALNLVIGLGLGLAIDYTLFLLTRYREELERQGPGTGAIATTMATAGRTVAFSAATVAAALVTLTVFPQNFLISMGIAGALVAVVAALAALLVTPALLGLWGEKLARRPRRRSAGAATGAGGWYRLSHAVMRRPGAIAAVTAVAMAALALPALQASWAPVDERVIPEGLSGRVVADTIQRDFAGAGSAPVTIALRADAGERDAAAAAARYAAAVRGLPDARAVTGPVRLDARTWQVDIATTGRPEDAAAQRLVSAVRAVETPLDAKVAGPAAEFVDQQDAIGSRLALAIALLVGLTMVVLWLMTGSVVLPVKAVVMNALTVGVALGALKLVFQDGRLTGLLGYTPNGGIETTDFLVAAALVFALSTDYGVFLLGRIKEAREQGLGEREAVAVGLERTGAVVTAAAILLAVAIGAFSTSSISFIQQIGVATAVGVLVDAFIVRSLLVPALMGLLGAWNWWSPAPLRRLHDRIGIREEPVAVAGAAVRSDDVLVAHR